MYATLFLLVTLNLSAYSFSGSEVGFGMSESELLAKTQAVKVGGEGSRGHGYTEFGEENPVVYVDSSEKDKKVEYYFHNGKLYKVMTIYRDRVNDENYYIEKSKELEGKFGQPDRKFSEQLFSLIVLHQVWENENEELDLRFGAGYVHEVITDKSLRKDKEKQDLYKHAI